jgi:hypothetical protein
MEEGNIEISHCHAGPQPQRPRSSCLKNRALVARRFSFDFIVGLCLPRVVNSK